MKRLLALSVLIFIIGFIGNAYAPDVQKFKVSVSVGINKNSESEISKAAIQSYINRELRSLKDVQIVADDYPGIWKYNIDVSMFAITRKGGISTGSASISTLFLEKIENNHFNDVWKPFHKKHPGYYYPRIQVYVYPIDELDQVCKEIVAEFDTIKLEEVRKLRTR